MPTLHINSLSHFACKSVGVTGSYPMVISEEAEIGVPALNEFGGCRL